MSSIAGKAVCGRISFQSTALRKKNKITSVSTSGLPSGKYHLLSTCSESAGITPQVSIELLEEAGNDYARLAQPKANKSWINPSKQVKNQAGKLGLFPEPYAGNSSFWKPAVSAGSDSLSLQNVISALLSSLQGGAEVEQAMEATVPRDMISRRFMSLLLTRLGERKKGRLAFAVWQWWRRSPQFQLDKRLCTKALSVVSRCQLAREARCLFEEMKASGLSVDAPAYNALLCALCRSRKMGEALQLFAEMETLGGARAPTAFTYATLILGLGRSGRVAEAEGLFETMGRRGVRANGVVYNTMINVYCRTGDVAGVGKVLEDMQRERVVPDAVTYTTLVRLYHRQGLHDRLAALWAGMRSQPAVRVDAKLYSAIIAAQAEGGDLSLVEDTLREMVGRGFKPDCATFASLLRAMQRSGNQSRFDALWSAVLEQFQGSVPHQQEDLYCCELAALVQVAGAGTGVRQLDARVVNVALEAYGEWGRVRQLEAAAALLKGQGGGNKETQEALVRGYALAGQVAAMERSVREMSARYRLTRRTYNAIITGYGRAGLLTKAEESLGAMRAAWVQPCAETWEALGEAYELAGWEEEAELAFEQREKLGVGGASRVERVL